MNIWGLLISDFYEYFIVILRSVMVENSNMFPLMEQEHHGNVIKVDTIT